MDGRVGTAPDTRSASVLDIAVIVAIIILWLSAAFLMNVRELLWDRSTSLLMEMTEQRALFLENYGFAEREGKYVNFYQGEGTSCVIDTSGEIISEPIMQDEGGNSRSLIKSLEMEDNSTADIKSFSEDIKAGRKGLRVLDYKGESTVFSYTAIQGHDDLIFVAMVPEKTVTSQSDEIMTDAVVLIACIISGIFVMIMLYFARNKKNTGRLYNQARYINYLYNIIPAAVALLKIESPYEVIDLNREGRRDAGYWRKEDEKLIHFRNLAEVICEEDYSKVMDGVRNLRKEGDRMHLDCRLRKVGGKEFCVSGIVERIKDSEGHPVLIAAYIDITARKEAEELVKAMQKEENISLLTALSNIYPIILNINLSKDSVKVIFERENSGGLQHPCTRYSDMYHAMLEKAHPEDREEFQKKFSPENLTDNLSENHKECSMEVRGKLSDGEYHWIFVQMVSIENSYSDEKIAVMLSRKIDEEKYEEKQQKEALRGALETAQTASKAKGQFLSNMSHDIRTPMNVIMGMAAIASKNIGDREVVSDCLNKINISGKHLLGLINDVLDMAKIESGRISPNVVEFNLKKVMENSLEFVEAEAERKGLEVKVEIDMDDVESVTGDPLRLQQILINILSNAVKYTEKGAITARAWKEESRQEGYINYVFQCSDTGIGMSRQFLDKIFDPFERAETSTESRVIGTGLGMSITKNLIDMMNGEIKVKSRLGQGSVFTVRIPLKTSNPEIENERNDETRENGYRETWEGRRILLAEDNMMNREITRHMLKDTGLIIDEACNGAEAVEKVSEAEAGYYCLVLMDIQMPVMDGYQASGIIRNLEDPEVAAIPIIAMTADAFEDDVRAAAAAGMNDHISKPVNWEKLKIVMSKFIR